MITGIEHIAVLAKDSKALTDWYCDMFGFEICYDNGKGTYFVKAADGSMLEIISAEGDCAPTGTKEWGIRHLALSVTEDGFDTMVEKLKKAEVEVVTDVSVSAKGIKTFFFRDIEGNIFHLIFRPTPL